MTSNLSNEVSALNPLVSDPKRCLAPSVPDLLKPNCKNYSESQSVDTSILQPNIVRNDYIRFVLDRKGILHSNSKISLRMKVVGASHKAFQPLTTGVLSQIKKCVLRVGTSVLDSTDSFNILSSYESLLLSNENAMRKERIKTGMVSAYKAVKTPTMTAGGVLDGTETISKMSLDLQKDFALSLTAGTGTSTRADDKCPVTVHDNQNLVNDSEFVIELSTLFKSLRFTQLPLFMLEQPVIIELFLESKNVNRICIPLAQASTPVYELDTTSPTLIADYIYYSADTMASFASSNPIMTLPFFENQLINTNVNYSDTPSFIRSLGGAGKAISTIKICHTQLNEDLIDSLLNRYKSNLEESGGNDISYNLKINDEFLFPVKISNPAEQFVNTLQAEGMPLNITGRDYDKTLGCSFTSSEVIELHDQTTDLTGNKRWLTIFNLGGQRINNRGIDLYLDVANANDIDLNQLVWLEISKTLILANGRFSETYN